MLTVLLLALLCACVYIIFAKSKQNAHKLPPPYRGAWPIIGHTHYLFTDTTKLWLTIQDTAKDAFEKGGVIHEMLGGQIYYMITDAEDAVTAANACLERHFAIKFVRSWLGIGLATASEEVWKQHRKLINPAFSLPVILRFLDSFNGQAKKLVQSLEPYVGKGPFVSAAHVKKIMLDTFCLSMFGLDNIEDESVIKNYMASTDVLMNMCTQRFQKVWLHNDFLYKLSGWKKKEEIEEANLNKMSYNVIQKKKTEFKNNILNENNDSGVKYRPALDLLLDLFRDGILTEKEISEETNNIIITGFETLTHQLQYALIFLGSNPETQNKMFEEILQVVGPERDVDREDLNQLVYTNAVIMESLRLIPAVPMLLRAVKKDVKLKNYTMRAGTQCILFPLVNIYDPTWGPSGEKFMPERWLGDPELCRKKEFAGFGLGKRGCIGKQYAMVAMKIFLVQLIRQYKVTANINRLKLKMDFVLKPVEGNEISIENRI